MVDSGFKRVCFVEKTGITNSPYTGGALFSAVAEK